MTIPLTDPFSVKKYRNGSGGDAGEVQETLKTGVLPGATIHYTLALERNGGSVILHATVENGETKHVIMTDYDADWASLDPTTGTKLYYKAGSYYPENEPVNDPIAGNTKVTFSSLTVTP